MPPGTTLQKRDSEATSSATRRVLASEIRPCIVLSKCWSNQRAVHRVLDCCHLFKNLQHSAGHDGRPAIAFGPARIREVLTRTKIRKSVKYPAVEEEALPVVEEVLNEGEHLAQSFPNIVRSIEKLSHLSKRQRNHHQGVFSDKDVR
ncbi:uncharacterized protein N7529_006882 [Penicillium soppii]|jgi:hypothetical protein|uniref:uncharacterized protein n=1 Tax=Penicillium soppii TaxID=69789 RepID=UPI0025489C82|nr:uncharacterized protein N7529_006882 [Penicillium soppii]KAJ5864966.1 hypothetical protein N7529_006882 [Penicillium soppii]